jgi:hypothetical protein
MPITFSQIAANTATISFPWAGETINLVYHPGLVTEKTIAQVQGMAKMDASTMETGFLAFNTMLAYLIKSWDVYEDEVNTVMFPLDPLRIAELPVMFRMRCIQEIMSDIRPNDLAPQS